MNLEDDFKKRLSELNLTPQKIFVKNSRKESITLLVTNEKSRKFLLKLHREDAPPSTKKSFQIERNFYLKNNDSDLIPQLEEVGDNYLLFQFISSLTFRNKLIQFMKRGFSQQEIKSFEKFLNENVTDLITYFEKVHKNSEGSISIDVAIDKLMSIYKKLATSGPHSTTECTLNKRISKKQARRSFSNVKQGLKNILKKNPALLRKGPTHHDLHLDNILVANENLNLFLVDFANYSKNSLILLDIVYFLSTSLTLLSVKPSLQEVFKRFIEREINPSLLDALTISELFHLIGVTNNRFNQEASFFRIVKEQMKFSSNLKQKMRLLAQ